MKEKLERKSGFKKKLNSLKEQYDKDKSKWADEIKHLEKKNSELKSDLDKKHSSDKESPKKDNDKDKKHSSDKATPKKDNDDKGNLNATIISMKVEKEKLTDQVARLKSSNLSKDKKLQAEISKLKESTKLCCCCLNYYLAQKVVTFSSFSKLFSALF